MIWRRRAVDGAAVGLLVAVAAAYVYGVFWRRAELGLTVPNFDYYGYFYPNLRYALDAWQRGQGLFWNSFQNCGQPFFANPSAGTLYPLHWLFLVFGPDRGQFVQVTLHLAIGGIGMYWLCRVVGARPLGALCGGLAFGLGGTTILLASWMPFIIAPFAWMPAAMAAAERVLRRPTFAGAVLLGVLLTLQLLPGYPQINFFTYMAIGVRLVWELASRRDARRVRVVAAVLFGLALPAALAAAQYVPAVEFVRESVRSGQLSIAELRPPAQNVDWKKFRYALGLRTALGNTLMLIPVGLAAVALTLPRHRRLAWSYAVMIALAFSLAFDTPVFDLFRRLPFGSSFRLPHRFLWLAGFATAVLAGLGADAVARADATEAPLRRRLAAPMAFAAAVLGFTLLSPLLLYPYEALLALATIAVISAVALLPPLRRLAPLALPLLVAAGALLFLRNPTYGPLIDTQRLYSRRMAFDWLRSRISPQERVYQFGARDDFGVIPKSSELYGVRGITDYETQASRRFAALHVRLFNNHPMRSLNDYYFKLLKQPANRPLFNLLAARYIVTTADLAPMPMLSQPPVKEVARFGDTVVYENPAALPRAFFVPQGYVVPETEDAITWFASGLNDPRRYTILESRPPDGFLGSPTTNGPSSVTLVADGGETLSLRVYAPADGYLVVTDQYYPGWEAAVNGRSTPVLRANAAFRAIRVPRGVSNVTFVYRPASLRLGAWISAVSWGLVVLYAIGAAAGRLWRSRRPAVRVAGSEPQPLTS